MVEEERVRLVQAARDESNDDEEDEPSKQDDGLPKALKPGSLLRRLGGGYYCEACMPLVAADLSARGV